MQQEVWQVTTVVPLVKVHPPRQAQPFVVILSDNRRLDELLCSTENILLGTPTTFLSRRATNLLDKVFKIKDWPRPIVVDNMKRRHNMPPQTKQFF